MDGSTPAPVTDAGDRRWSWRARLAPVSLVIGAIVVALDQVTKHWAVNALDDGREHHVVWTLQWNLASNTGMAFSRGRGLGPVIALFALLVVIVLVVSTAKVEGKLARFAAGLLIGGACGNLVDRVFRGQGWLHGAVVDFIDLQWWPIFNVADMAISSGAVLFALSTLLSGRRHPTPGGSSGSDASPSGSSAPSAPSGAAGR
jgi:signal peptidase II